ncbi:MAG: ECF transporter S component [Clostridiales bacterium]|nr:ECF transporter S component [Clostridiales bacterium]
MSPKTLAACSMLSAIAFVFTIISHYVMPAMIPAAPWLKYDPKDIIIAIGGLIFGVVPAMLMSVVVSFIEMVTISSTGWIGALMNILATWAFVIPPAVIYSKRRTFPAAVAGLVSGVILMTGVMLLWNYLLTPIYMGWPREEVAKLLLPAFMPFNLIKGALNMAFTLVIYKPLVKAMRLSKLMPPAAKGSELKKNTTVITVLVAAVIIISSILVILAINGKI